MRYRRTYRIKQACIELIVDVFLKLRHFRAVKINNNCAKVAID